MSKTRFLSAVVFFLVTALLPATLLCAQSPERDREGDRDREGGEGGPPGGFGQRGGPPGGGPAFGGPGFGGPGFGGPPPGFGGPPGGFGGRGGRGERGGPGGSFDPSSFLSRLDANGNGMIDPEEQQGPAQFIIARLGQSDPSIKAGQPISLKKLADSFAAMRGQGDPGGSDDSRRAGDEALEPQLLVPGFGIEEMPTPLLGFGAAAEMLSVPVTEADEREALERLQRYDSNRDGYLSAGEISRFSGNPMDFDRNRDGKLSQNELAVRYARRREGEEEARRDERRDDRRREPEKPIEVPDVFNGRKSYRISSGRSLPEGVPGFFTDRDANGDGQVTMAEFSDDWSDEVVARFFESDLNRDGVITSAEALRSVEQSSSAPLVSTSTPAPTSSPSPSPPGSGPPAPPASGKPDEKYVKVVQRILERYDANKDGVLTPSEWSKMLMSPAEADANRDGRITVDEYALWMQSRTRT
jgi:Ca2+-binding EF-hand superfamily protein